jgi:hypothetical protein
MYMDTATQDRYNGYAWSSIHELQNAYIVTATHDMNNGYASGTTHGF